MRVAIVSDYLDPEDWGGASRVAAAQAQALAGLGHQVLVTGASGHDATLEGKNLHHVHWRHPRGLRGAWRLRTRTLTALKDFRPDHVVLHQPLCAMFVQKALPDLPSTYFFHSSWRDERATRGQARAVGVRHRIEASALRRARDVQVTSPFTREVLEGHHPCEVSRSTMNPLGVWSPPHMPDASARGRLVSRYGLDPERPILASFRRLVPRTGVDLLLNCLASLEGVQLLVGGDGPQRPDVERVIEELSLAGRVRLLGYVDEDERISILQGADASVVPTLELEGFGLATLESMACGTPVAATPVGNNPNLLREVTGGEVAKEVTAESLSLAIRNVLEGDWPPEDLARRAVHAFSWEEHARRLIP